MNDSRFPATMLAHSLQSVKAPKKPRTKKRHSFLRKVLPFALALILALIYIVGQAKQRAKNDAQAEKQGNVLSIQSVQIKPD